MKNYIGEFIQTVFKKSHTGAIIWIALNCAIMIAAGAVIGAQDSVGSGILGGFLGALIYILSGAIALSPVGEFIMRALMKCPFKIDPEDEDKKDIYERIYPLFERVYQEAMQTTPELSKNIGLYYCKDEEPNAFAVGRQSVCFQKGLLALTDEEIMGVFAHELGHLAHKDTMLSLFVCIGNFLVTAVVTIAKVVFHVLRVVFHYTLGLFLPVISSISDFFTDIIIDVAVVGFMFLWTRLGMIVVQGSSREEEFEADRYAYLIGYGQPLYAALHTLDGGKKSHDGLWAVLSASHPATSLRLERLHTLLTRNELSEP